MISYSMKKRQISKLFLIEKDLFRISCAVKVMHAFSKHMLAPESYPVNVVLGVNTVPHKRNEVLIDYYFA